METKDTTKNFPEASAFTEKCNKALQLISEANEINLNLRKDVTDALEDIAVELDQPLLLIQEVRSPISDDEDFDDEPKYDEYSNYAHITGFRFNEDEGVAEVLEDGWDDEDDDEDDDGDSEDKLEGYAHSIYRMDNYDLCNLYGSVKQAYDLLASAKQ